MFTKKQIARYADVLLWGLKISRKGRIRKNDTVLIRYHLPALALAEALYDRLLDMGLNPLQRVRSQSRYGKEFFQTGQLQTAGLPPPPETGSFMKILTAVFFCTHLNPLPI